MRSASKRSSQASNPLRADTAATSPIAGGAANANKVGANREHGRQVFRAQSSRDRREQPCRARPVHPRGKALLRQQFQDRGSVFAYGVQQYSTSTGAYRSVEDRFGRQRAHELTVRVRHGNERRPPGRGASHCSGHQGSSRRFACNASETSFHERSTRSRERKSDALSVPLVTDVTQRSADRAP